MTTQQPEARLFTKKPVTISATQWFKNGDHPQVRAIAPSDDLFFTGMGGAMLTGREKYGVIGTLESPNHLVTPGDWIITGVAGEHYACKPDIFEATYSPAALAAGQADSVPAVEREQERIAFKDAHRHLDLDEMPDAWGRPMFKHSHVEASWLGWIARAPHGQAPTGATEPTEQQILEAAEKAGLWPNTVHSWIPAFHRYHKELAKAQPSPTAQADSVQEDAVRYRWLREGNDAKHGAAWHVAVNLYGCEWDAAIDAAMNKGATQ